MQQKAAFSGSRCTRAQAPPAWFLQLQYARQIEGVVLSLGQTSIDSAKTAQEHAAISAQVTRMKARVKLFDDRQAELAKLRAPWGNTRRS
jgi:hypothetical protein